MESPWGSLRVADAHVHFFSHRFFSLLAAQRGNESAADLQPILGWAFPPESPVELARAWAAELDLHGVSRACLIASLPGDEGSSAAAVAAFPDRFYGYFLANPLAPGAVESAKRAFEGGCQGLCLFPAMHAYSLHDDRVTPLIELAASAPGRLVFVHCGILTVGVRRKLGLPSRFDLRYSNPVDIHALALRHPKLPFVIPHFGAGYLREALMVADLCPNIYLDTSSTNSWVKYIVPTCDLKQVFTRALDVLGPQRLLFGTDSSFFPRGWHKAIFDEQVAVLRELGVSAEEAASIFGGNLSKVLERPA